MLFRSGMANVGVVLLLFVAGLETDMVEMRRVGAAAMLAAIGGVALPMGGAWVVARWLGYGNAESAFIGTVLTATSVTVSAHVLRELGYLQTKVGSAILGAAIIDDVIGVIVLTVVISVEGGGGWFDLVRVGAFIPIALVIGYFLTAAAAHRMLRLESKEHRYVELLAIMLVFAWAAEALGGLAAISGAYLAGVLFGRTILRDDMAEFGNTIGFAFFAPVFFVITGMMADVRTLADAPLLTISLLIVAILGKVIGCYAGALGGKFGHREALAVGAGMVSRGEVAIVIAVLGKTSGVLGDTVFTSVIAVTLLTTLVAPLLLRLTLPGVSSRTETDPASVRQMRLVSQLDQLQI